MLQAATLQFLKGLKKNNNKPWFEKNKGSYLDAKEDLENFVQQLIDGLAKTDAGFALLKPKDCVFRIYRDVRFAKDKTPYKTNMGASFNRGGKKAPTAGFYFHCEPGGKSFAGGGMWMPAELGKIRQEIDYSFAEWKKITGHKNFRKLFPDGVEGAGDDLSRPPKGYDDQNPAIGFLKMKSYIVTRSFTDAGIQSKSLLKEVLKTFETMKDFIGFLNRSLE